MNGNSKGKEFEEKVADCYRKLGYDVKPNQNLCGFQIDLLIEKRGGGFLDQIIVECKDKQINKDDRNQILAQQNAIHKQYPAYRWIVVSSHGITSNTLTAFKATGVQFVRYVDLLDDVFKPGYSTNNIHEEPQMHPTVPKKAISDGPKIFDTTEQLKLEQSSTPEISKPQRLPIVQIGVGNSSEDQIRAVAYSLDGKLIACGGDDFVMLYRLSDNKIIQIFDEHKGIVNSVCFSPDGKLLASAGEDSTIRLWDLKALKVLQIFSGHTASVSSVIFSSDGKSLASGSDDKTIRLWDLTGKTLHVLEGHSEDVTSVDFSPDGNRLISGSKDKTIRLWNVKEGKFICKMKSNRQLDVVRSVKFSPDGTRIVSCGNDNKVILWDAVNTKSLYVLKDEWDEFCETRAVCFSPDGKRVVGGSEKRLCLWDVEKNQILQKNDKGKWIYSVNFSPDGHYILVGSREVLFWNLEKNILENIPVLRKSITKVDFSNDETNIAFGNNDNKLFLLDVKESKLVRIFTFKNRIHFTDRIYFSPNKKFIMGGGFYRRSVWNIETGKPIFNGEEIRKFSSDGKYKVCDPDYPGPAKNLNIYDIENEKLVSSIRSLYNLEAYEDFEILDISFDRKYLVSGSSSRIQFLEVEKGISLYVFEINDKISYMTFSPNGSYFAANIGKKNDRLCVWNAKDGKLLHTLEAKSGLLSERQDEGIAFRFSPDSKRIITYSDPVMSG